MAYSIGPKIQIDGEKEFRKSISDINAQLKAMSAEMKAATAAFDANGDEQGKLKKQSELLAAQIDAQKKRYALLEDAVAKATDKYGKESVEATRLRGALYDTDATIKGLERDLGATSEALDNFGKDAQDAGAGAERVGDAADDAEPKIKGFADIFKGSFLAGAALDSLKEIGSRIIEIGKASIEAAADVRAETAQFEQTFGDLDDSAREALNSVAQNSGVTATRVQSSFTKMYAFVKTLGADSEEALDIASRAMSAAADNAAYYDRSLEDVTESLQSFLKGNYANDAALGIAATETTRNTAANKKYGKSFKELSEAQKTDVLLSMVEAGNDASGAIGQAARESDQWTNVIGEFNEAGRQMLAVIGDPVLSAVTPIIQGITAAMNRLLEKSDWQKLRDDINSFRDSMESADETYQSTTESVYAAAFEAEYYASKLRDLEKAGLNTDESQRQYRAAVDAINEIMPELNLQIDEQTGLIDQNTDAIFDNIDAWKEKALQDALQEMYKDKIAARAKAEASLLTAQSNLQKLEDSRAITIKKIEEATNGASDADKAYIKSLLDSEGALWSATSAADVYNQILQSEEAVTLRNVDGLYDMLLALGENGDQQRQLTDEIEKSSKTMSEYDADLEELTDTEKYYAEATGSAADKTAEMGDSAQATLEAVSALEEEYSAAKDSAMDSINSQIGLFQQLATESETSAEEIVSNWEDQQRAFENYAANLKQAKDSGMATELLQQLSDGSEQSMLMLDALVSGTDVDIAAINDAFSNLSKAKDTAADIMSDIQTDFSDRMAELETSAESSGANIANGLQSGFDRNAWRFITSVGIAANNAIDRFNSAFDIHSPSRVMQRSAGMVVDGAVIGVDDSAGRFAKAMERLAVSGDDAFARRSLDRAAYFPTDFTGRMIGSTQNTALTVGDIVVNVDAKNAGDPQEIAVAVADQVSRIINNRTLQRVAANG